MELSISSNQKREVIDITGEVQDLLERVRAQSGVCVVSALHTTAAITTGDLDPGTDKDLLEFLNSLVPEGIKWRHPHDPSHVPDHLLASLIGPSVTVSVSKGRIRLGQWQRIILVELDGPRDRNVSVSFVPTA